MLNDFEKLIYNKHLSCYKKVNKQPFNFRKNFDELDESTIFFLKKLSLFFNKFKNINIDIFFKAPYEIYKDEKFFDLKFYISPKAVKAYNLYTKQLEFLEPDSIECLTYTTQSLKFIKNFCNENNIKVSEYIDFVSKDNTLPAFVSHLQNHNINFYSIMGYDNSITKISKHFETYKFVLGNILENIDNIYNMFIKSKRLKFLVREGLKKIT